MMMGIFLLLLQTTTNKTYCKYAFIVVTMKQERDFIIHLLEFFHCYLQGIGLSLKLHHYRGTHPVRKGGSAESWPSVKVNYFVEMLKATEEQTQQHPDSDTNVTNQNAGFNLFIWDGATEKEVL